jgi:alkanesulfonate monooxygenase SsuD/methylene tetrahydromethanopterin reductase-like flavin-dependent oxidoreductase (luciferase family)
VRFGAAFWVNRTTWREVLDAALAVERAGWDSIWIDDHLLVDEGDETDAKLEGWAILAALATTTTRPRLGVLVAANTFRNPGLTAKLATTLDHLSGGRAILGLGGGWFGREHAAYGIDFGGGFGERLDRLDEATGLIRRLLDGERVTHTGRFYALRDALVAPGPVQARLPILIGGSGPTKTLRTTARYADLWNGFGEPDRIADVSAVLEQRCAEIGRPFEAIERTITANVVIRDTVEGARRAWEATAVRHGLVGRVGPDGTERDLTVGGWPADVAAYLAAYAALGVAEVMIVFRSPFDLETLERIGEVREALGALGAPERSPTRPS